MPGSAVRYILLFIVISFSPGCVTLADRVATIDDLIDQNRLNELDRSKNVSIETDLSKPMQVSLKFAGTDAYEAKYNYDTALGNALSKGLARMLNVAEPGNGIDHFRVVFEDISAYGSCSNYGGLSTCSQSVTFKATVALERSGAFVKSETITGSNTVREGDFLMPISSVDPLHRKAAKAAFTELVSNVALKIQAEMHGW